MITAKQLFGSAAHVQLRYYIWQTMPEADDFKKAAALGALVKKFVANRNDQHPHENDLPESVDEAFIWSDTNEGHEFWREIEPEFLIPEEFFNKWLGKPKPVKQPKQQAPKPKRVGWWQ